MNELIRQIKDDLLLAKKNGLTCLTISTTSGNELNYLTPIRLIHGVAIMGCVVHSTNFCCSLVREVLGLVDYFFIDVEKKLAPITVSYEIDTRNIYHPIKAIVGDVAPVIPYKPNDLTVDAIYDKVIKECLDLRDCTVGIIGFGNIGSKISLKLVESGMDICVLPKKISYKEQNLVNCINSIKHGGAIASAILTDNIYKFLLKSDVIICCATAKNVLDSSTIPFLKNKKLVLDVGKNNVSKDVINSIDQGFYCDVTNQIVDFVLSKVKVSSSIQKIVSEQVKSVEGLHYVGSLLSEPGIFYCIIHGKVNFLGVMNDEGGFRRFNYEEILILREKYVD